MNLEWLKSLSGGTLKKATDNYSLGAMQWPKETEAIHIRPKKEFCLRIFHLCSTHFQKEFRVVDRESKQRSQI